MNSGKIFSNSSKEEVLSIANRQELARKHYSRKSQFRIEQIEWIIAQAGDRMNGQVLFFGSGYDSPMWARICDVCFLEDNVRFYRKLFDPSHNCAIKAWPVIYHTRKKNWEADLSNQTRITLPREIETNRFDVIIIDGPRGDKPEAPGRVSPAVHSKELVKPGGMIFMDDLHRKVDLAIAESVFGLPNATLEGRSTIGCWEVGT